MKRLLSSLSEVEDFFVGGLAFYCVFDIAFAVRFQAVGAQRGRRRHKLWDLGYQHSQCNWHISATVFGGAPITGKGGEVGVVTLLHAMIEPALTLPTRRLQNELPGGCLINVCSGDWRYVDAILVSRIIDMDRQIIISSSGKGAR